MSKVISSLIGSIAFGEVQEHSRMAVQPIVCKKKPELDYLSLSEAVANKVLAISEVSEGGSVPELRAVNTGELLVLIMDGEELVGAKQNRVLNTTVLLPTGETILSVSCVEAHRWHRTSDHFSPSEEILTPSMRERKHHQVNLNLERHGSRSADQGDVWRAVEEMTLRSATPMSETKAMRDVYRHRDLDLRTLAGQFALVPGQVGMAVFIDGELAGIEYLSQPRVFERVFNKLLRSYALDALMEEAGADGGTIDAQIAPGILAAINAAEMDIYEAVGTGREHRITGDCVVGSALSLDDEVLHLSLQASEKQVAFPRTYWVQPGRLLAGCYPGDGNHDGNEGRDKLSGLLDSGIRAVVNLMERGEVNHSGEPFVPYRSKLVDMGIERGIPVVVVRKPIRDVDVPTREGMKAILDKIDALLAMGPVYVHCWGGRGRTGTVVGCWLARHGIARGDQAIEHINKLRRKDPTRHRPSPQTHAQREMIRTWRENE